jgi:ribosomal protein S18 acetylase RimI-like enzyme
MNKSLELEPYIILNEPGNADINNEIYQGLKAYNESKIGPYSFYPYTIHIESDEGKVIGGLKGDVFGVLARVDLLWVHEDYRNRTIGTRLIKALEKFARAKNCEIIQLDTADFQAKGFYEKCGFKVVATLEKNFMGHIGCYMRKEIESLNHKA